MPRSDARSAPGVDLSGDRRRRCCRRWCPTRPAHRRRSLPSLPQEPLRRGRSSGPTDSRRREAADRRVSRERVAPVVRLRVLDGGVGAQTGEQRVERFAGRSRSSAARLHAVHRTSGLAQRRDAMRLASAAARILRRLRARSRRRSTGTSRSDVAGWRAERRRLPAYAD